MSTGLLSYKYVIPPKNKDVRNKKVHDIYLTKHKCQDDWILIKNANSLRLKKKPLKTCFMNVKHIVEEDFAT